MPDTVLVVAVHPDDETLGCGGTLLKHREQGDMIHWLIVTGITVNGGFSQEQVTRRAEEIETVADGYCFSSVHQLNLPTTCLDMLPRKDLVRKISEVFQLIKPDILYLPFSNDVHSDHRVAFECTYSCTKVFRYPYIRKICLMETLTETEFAPANAPSFTPNLFVNITEQMEKKLEILALYPSEMGQHPFPRSAETTRALAMFRGSSANCDYAESFMLLKEIR